MAMWAGAELIDMECIQFHPTGMVWPPSVRGTLITEGVRGEGGVLLNGKGERFMFRYVPDMFKGEYAETEEETQQWIASTMKRDANGSSPAGTAQARRGCSGSSREIRKGAARRTAVCTWTSRRGEKRKTSRRSFRACTISSKSWRMWISPAATPMEVGPTCHYMMGGVRVDAETQEATTVPGLYAAGEVSGGMHGANRLGGNSLSDLLVFGKRAGEFAAKQAKATSQGAVNPDRCRTRGSRAAPRYFGDEQGENPYAIHEESLRATMQSLVGIVRTDEDLRAALTRA